MTSFEDILKVPAFSLDDGRKAPALLDQMKELSRFHHRACPRYGRAIDAHFPRWAEAERLGDVPYLPVGVFKREELGSLGDDKPFRVLMSSGTTGSLPSRIVLDVETAQRQTRSLAAIMTHFLGERRLPMLIIDSQTIMANRTQYTARTAGVLGMMSYGRDPHFALDAEMRLDLPATLRWIKKHSGGPVFVFGFTFMVWQYFVEAAAGTSIDLSGGVLVHGGGWKKLQAQSVDNGVFKATLRDRFGLRRVHNFYGMVEQVGSIFVECEEGRLHSPNFADVLVRDPRTWEVAPAGVPGLIQALSPIPRSYPGHSLLTEDIGVWHGVDDCACGRKGRTFSVTGRVPKVELRGCSDTHAAGLEEATDEA